MKALALGSTAMAALLFLGGPTAQAADPEPRHDQPAAQGETLSLSAADEYIECSWVLDPYTEWWWDDSYTLTSVGVEPTGDVECSSDIYSIESELYVHHDETRISLDEDNCVSDDGSECAESSTAATHTCTAGTACAGDWTPELEIRLELRDGTSWDADTFPDYCSVQGAEDEVVRCNYVYDPPVHVPPTFPPDAEATA
ncbi:hypothetical protein [Streptomyces sp. MP131-18]|uniref:hypothetical protein n=1 Tax=Streptomyces sp. MP131-18 TaxID=1857892 RepID=UPI0009CEF080|nr:hypothetical protein [Streptomyces sp. MP131-18]ONK14573.1 hypothetical protein STBA_53580 [Streptomyces sp. MP131-18]